MSDPEPVSLIEDLDTGDRFLFYGDDAGVRIELRYRGDALWMTQAQIASLFGRDVSVISRHITSIINEGELGEEGNLQKVQIASATKPVTLYSLDVVIAVGYRVSTRQGTLFRRWATDTLVRFATKGFVIDAARLKRPEEIDRLAELREIIRDIRSDESNVYRELRRICALCQDYDADSAVWRDFYTKTQTKIVYAVTSQTPAEVIRDRADASQPDMGMTSWPHSNIRKSDVSTSKNYFSNAEIAELNRLTTILLDIFEDQAAIGRMVMMEDARSLLDRQLSGLGRAVLRSGGRISAHEAKRHAEAQYALYDADRKIDRHRRADEQIAALRKEDVVLPRRTKS